MGVKKRNKMEFLNLPDILMLKWTIISILNMAMAPTTATTNATSGRAKIFDEIIGSNNIHTLHSLDILF